MDAIGKILELDVPNDTKNTLIKLFANKQYSHFEIEKTNDPDAFLVGRDNVFRCVMLSGWEYYNSTNFITLKKIYKEKCVEANVGITYTFIVNSSNDGDLYYATDTAESRQYYFRIKNNRTVPTYYYYSTQLMGVFLEIPTSDNKCMSYGAWFSNVRASNWTKYEKFGDLNLIHTVYQKYGIEFGFTLVTQILSKVLPHEPKKSITFAPINSDNIDVDIDGALYRANIKLLTFISHKQIKDQLKKIVIKNNILEEYIYRGLTFGGVHVWYSHMDNENNHHIWMNNNSSYGQLKIVKNNTVRHGVTVCSDGVISWYDSGNIMTTTMCSYIWKFLCENPDFNPTEAFADYILQYVNDRVPPMKPGHVHEFLGLYDDGKVLRCVTNNAVIVDIPIKQQIIELPSQTVEPQTKKTFKTELNELAIKQFKEYIMEEMRKNAFVGELKLPKINENCHKWLVEFCKEEDIEYVPKYVLRW